MNLFQVTTLSNPASILISSPDLIFHGFLKIIFIFGALMYLIFAALVTRQIALMGNTVFSPSTWLVKLLGFAHLVIAISVLVFYIILL